MASVQLSDVSFGYGERALFCGLDLELAQGKVTSIIGPNGCGKSSLLKLASGICKPWEGSIRVLGHDFLQRARTAAELAGAGARGTAHERAAACGVREVSAPWDVRDDGRSGLRGS